MRRLLGLTLILFTCVLSQDVSYNRYFLVDRVFLMPFVLKYEEEKKVREVLADVASVKVEMSMLNAKEVRFLKGVLTPEQFKRLKDIALVRLLELQP